MIDPIAAAGTPDRTRLAHATTHRPATTHGGASFAGELARYVATPTGSAATTTKAEPRPKTEKSEKVEGHPYARIENGADKGLLLNQVAGSPREGRVFKLVERDDRVFHVYGAGKDTLVVEVKHTAKTDAGPTLPTGGATSSTT